MSARVERLLAIDLEVSGISDYQHRLAVRKTILRQERLSLLVGLSQQDADDLKAATQGRVGEVVRMLDHLSAVRAAK